jgi:hypothetical protein
MTVRKNFERFSKDVARGSKRMANLQGTFHLPYLWNTHPSYLPYKYIRSVFLWRTYRLGDTHAHHIQTFRRWLVNWIWMLYAVLEYFKGKSILVTGSTGFLGKGTSTWTHSSLSGCAICFAQFIWMWSSYWGFGTCFLLVFGLRPCSARGEDIKGSAWCQETFPTCSSHRFRMCNSEDSDWGEKISSLLASILLFFGHVRDCMTKQEICWTQSP